jgi:hypothetical protein
MSEAQARTMREMSVLLTRAATLLTQERSILLAQMAGHRFSRAKQSRLDALNQWLSMYAYAAPTDHGDDPALDFQPEDEEEQV